MIWPFTYFHRRRQQHEERRYTTERMSCEAWKSNHHGAVDSPPDYGAIAMEAYEAEEGHEAWPTRD